MVADVERIEKCGALHQMADWLEANPDVPFPFSFKEVYAAGCDRAALVAVAHAAPFAEKEIVGDNYFGLRVRIGSLSIYFYGDREQVCEKVVIGQEIVAEQVIPAHTKEVVEWRCTEPLLAPKRGGVRV